MFRTTAVHGVKVRSVLFSAVIHVGDVMCLSPESKVLAIQRQVPQFSGQEGDLRKYATFQQAFPRLFIDESFSMTVIDRDPFIRVNTLNMLGVSTSASIQVGSVYRVNAENRTKHIRRLVRSPEQT